MPLSAPPPSRLLPFAQLMTIAVGLGSLSQGIGSFYSPATWSNIYGIPIKSQSSSDKIGEQGLWHSPSSSNFPHHYHFLSLASRNIAIGLGVVTLTLQSRFTLGDAISNGTARIALGFTLLFGAIGPITDAALCWRYAGSTREKGERGEDSEQVSGKQSMYHALRSLLWIGAGAGWLISGSKMV